MTPDTDPPTDDILHGERMCQDKKKLIHLTVSQSTSYGSSWYQFSATGVLKTESDAAFPKFSKNNYSQINVIYQILDIIVLV